MIISHLVSEGSGKMKIATTFEGRSEDILREAMAVNAEIIRMLRKYGISDEDIEKQLVNNIMGGFRMVKEQP